MVLQLKIKPSRAKFGLQLIAQGGTTREIAKRLFVSLKTVSSHRRHLMEKLKVHSTAELTKIAVREGLVTL